MLTVTGEVTPFQGNTELELGIGKQKLKHTVLIADLENKGILRMDFHKAYQCDLVLTRQIMKINGEEILCFANSRIVQPTCCRVAVLEPTEIPPESEMIVSGYTKGIIDKCGTGLIEAYPDFSKGLLVAKALVCPTTGTVPVRIANPFAQSYKLYKNTIVATYKPIEPELLVSVNTTQFKDSPTESCRDKELPEHMKELYSESSKLLNSEEQSQLKNLLINYQNQFLKILMTKEDVHCLNIILI